MQTLGKLFVSCVFVLSATVVQAGEFATGQHGASEVRGGGPATG